MKKTKRKAPPKRFGYMCKVDFDYELGYAGGGNIIYPTIKGLKAFRCCWDECGIVKVKVTKVKTVLKDKLDR